MRQESTPFGFQCVDLLRRAAEQRGEHLAVVLSAKGRLAVDSCARVREPIRAVEHGDNPAAAVAARHGHRPGAGLLGRQRFAERLHPGRGQAVRVTRGHRGLCARLRSHPRADDRFQLGHAVHALGIGVEALVGDESRVAHQRRKRVPVHARIARDDDVAPLARIDPRAQEVGLAAAEQHEVGRLLKRQQRVVHGHVDELPGAGALAKMDRCDDRKRGLQSGDGVADGEHRVDRLLAERARLAVDEARGRVHDAREGALGALRAVVAEAADRAVDEARTSRSRSACWPRPRPSITPGRKFSTTTSHAHASSAAIALPCVRAQVDRDVPLAAVLLHEVAADAAAALAETARQVALGRLDLDDVGAEVGEDAGAEGPGQHVAEVGHPYPLQGIRAARAGRSLGHRTKRIEDEGDDPRWNDQSRTKRSVPAIAPPGSVASGKGLNGVKCSVGLLLTSYASTSWPPAGEGISTSISWLSSMSTSAAATRAPPA